MQDQHLRNHFSSSWGRPEQSWKKNKDLFCLEAFVESEACEKKMPRKHLKKGVFWRLGNGLSVSSGRLSAWKLKVGPGRSIEVQQWWNELKGGKKAT